MNSLNLAQMSGFGVGHIDHPGTTVQSAGAIVIKFFYLLGSKNTDMVSDVLLRPEYYLTRINFAFIIMTCISLFVLGYVSYKKTGNIYAAVLLQFTPFFPSTVYDHFTDVSSESLFIVSILLFLSVAIFTSGKTGLIRYPLKYVILFGAVCGFGIASKIIFFPLLIIPLFLINGIQNKILFILVTAVSFLIFVFPAISSENSSKYVNWISGIASHSGKYGTGRESVIETSAYIDNLGRNFLYDISFTLTYLFIAVVFFLQFFSKFTNQIRTNPYFKFLSGIFITMTVLILLVAKQFDPRYMIPAYMLCVTGLLTGGFIIKNILPYNFRRRWLIGLSIVIFSFSLFRFITIFKEYSDYSNVIEESKKINKYMEENYPQSVVIKSNIINNREYCLYFGSDWAGTQKDKYKMLLKNLYPDFFYFDRYANDFYLTDVTYLRTKLQNEDKFIFLSDNKNLVAEFMERLKKLTGKENAVYSEVYASNNGETIYEIVQQP
jgi:hypothetical protein